jgi:chromosome segregation ATPase
MTNSPLTPSSPPGNRTLAFLLTGAQATDFARLAATTELEKGRHRMTELEKGEKQLTRTLEESQKSHKAAMDALKAEHRDVLADQKTIQNRALADLKASLEREREQVEKELDAAQAKHRQLEDNLEATRSERASPDGILKERTAELERVNAALADTRKDASRLRDAAEARSNALAEVRATLAAERESRTAAESRESDSRTQLKRLEGQLERFTKQLAALEKSSASRDRNV